MNNCSLFDISEVEDSFQDKNSEYSRRALNNIMANEIPYYEVQKILSLQSKPLEQVMRETQPYDDFEVCKKALFDGIDAIKFNYSNNQVKKVRLWVSQDLRTLWYRDVNPGVLSCLKGA